jgi:hypothetical protein
MKVPKVDPRQFFTLISQHASQGGIGFQNSPIEIANADPDHSRFKQLEEAEIEVGIAQGLNLGRSIHAAQILIV